MKLSEVKEILQNSEKISIHLPDGSRVPAHFHVTEIGRLTRDFIDCGGTVRQEQLINFQLWTSIDYHHRLRPEKLLQIIELSEKTLGLTDGEVEVEYQTDTIGKYRLEHDGSTFRLENMHTDCLAQDACGISLPKVKLPLSNLGKDCCTPGSGCC